ncbi:hypothetical protein JCM3775_005886 [Rhodotorula graminis]
MLKNLSRLKGLFIDNLDAPLLGVFFDETASGPLASLRQVSVQREGPFVPVDDQDRETVDWAQRLSRLPRLEQLGLLQYSNTIAVLPDMVRPPYFGSLKRLNLHAEDCPGWMRPELAQVAPNVVELKLHDWFPVAWFASALLNAPVELRKLVLECEGDAADGGVPVPVHNVLERFPHLERLELCDGAFDYSLPTALPSLLNLAHLHTLVFTYESACDDFLVALLQNPHHLPQLSRLAMSYTTSCRGPTVQEKGCFPSRPKHTTLWPMWPRWTPPDYTPGCSERARRAVTQAAQTRSIVVVGTALEALGWQTAFDDEQRFALLSYGDATVDFAPAREVLGDDLVDELIDLSERAWWLEYSEVGESGEWRQGADSVVGDEE